MFIPRGNLDMKNADLAIYRPVELPNRCGYYGVEVIFDTSHTSRCHNRFREMNSTFGKQQNIFCISPKLMMLHVYRYTFY